MDLPPDALVIRFRPTDPAAVLKWAEKEYRRTGRHLASVFADTAQPGEARGDVLRRLLRASELEGVRPENNPKFWVCAQAADVVALGLTFVKDGYDGEPSEHYSIDLGPAPTEEQVTRLLEVFRPERRQDA